MIDHAMWLVTIVSIVGNIGNIHQRRWCFAVWGVTNILWVAYDIHKTAYPQAALMATYFALCVWGWFRWKKLHNDRSAI